METNALYYGDNLSILRDFIPDESVDLIYLDPPFNSNRDYNLIFKDQAGSGSSAQILAFEDTWTWGPDASSVYDYLTNTTHHRGEVPDAVSQIVAALRAGIGPSEMLAYLVEMTVRLVEMKRVLKADGSLYLHCDPTASHYLKVILDAIFGPTNFISEIVWQRTNARGTTGRWPRLHDVILQYSKTPSFRFKSLSVQADERRMPHTLVAGPGGVKFQTYELTAPGTSNGPSGQPWRGFDPASYGRHWANNVEMMDQWDRQGLIHWPPKGGWPRRLDSEPFSHEKRRVVVGDIWTDIDRINQTAKERQGYPTQKPVALLERIIEASSDPNDIVLDPFCGCGTALVAAQKLGRRWVGIDVTYLSIAVMKSRLHDVFGIEAPIIGAPTEVEGARALAEQGLNGRYQFQQWALTLVDAAPAGPATPKKGADSGIDGKLTFTDVGGKLQTVIISVKSGGVNRGMVSDLAGVVQRDGAAMGLFITLEEPTKPMLQDAAAAGEFYSELSKRSYPKIQIMTIRELLDGRKPEIPLLVLPAYQQAERADAPSPGQVEMFGG